jgi:flagellar protein FliS
MPNSTISQYRGNQIAAATPEKTVLMLYDGAIRFLRSAIKEIEENNNIPEKAMLLEKTVKIVDYLHSCLDKEKGGEISKNLDTLYQHMSIKLTKANLKNDTKLMEDVLGLLLTVREGWNEICDKKSKEGQSAASPVTAGNNGGADAGAEPVPNIKVGIKA